MNPSILPSTPEGDCVKPNIVKKCLFLVNLIVLLVVKFDFSLVSTIVIFYFYIIGK